MTNDELVRLLLERVAEAEEFVTEEEKDEAYCEMVEHDSDSVFDIAARVIAKLLLGGEE